MFDADQLERMYKAKHTNPGVSTEPQMALQAQVQDRVMARAIGFVVFPGRTQAEARGLQRQVVVQCQTLPFIDVGGGSATLADRLAAAGYGPIVALIPFSSRNFRRMTG